MDFNFDNTNCDIDYIWWSILVDLFGWFNMKLTYCKYQLGNLCTDSSECDFKYEFSKGMKIEEVVYYGICNEVIK